MKRSIIPVILGGVALCLSNCKKEELPLYNDASYVQFEKGFQDTTVLSFFFHPGKSEVQIAMPVKLVGPMNETDLRYEIGVFEDETTASPSHYSIPSSFTFRKGGKVDTAYITVKNASDLQTREVKLAFFIKDTPELRAGQHEYAYHVMKISDMVSKPMWWDANMDRFYLGVYSERKFRAFMEVTGVGDLSAYNDNERRVLMLQFKYHLIAMKDAGTPLLLEDGSDMLASVPLIG